MRLVNWVWGGFLSFREKHPRFSAWIGRYGIYLMVLFFILLYSMISLLKHMNFQSHGWDLGIFDQHTWQLSNFEFGFNTVRMVPSLWGDHFHPIFFLVAPAYWIWSDARMLLIYQAVIVALGALPVFYVVKRNFESRTCALLPGPHLPHLLGDHGTHLLRLPHRGLPRPRAGPVVFLHRPREHGRIHAHHPPAAVGEGDHGATRLLPGPVHDHLPQEILYRRGHLRHLHGMVLRRDQAHHAAPVVGNQLFLLQVLLSHGR